jgi:hypothetical protein
VKCDYLFFVENLLTKKLKAAHATRLRFCQDKELNVTAELSQAAVPNNHEMFVVSNILGARCNAVPNNHELFVARLRNSLSFLLPSIALLVQQPYHTIPMFCCPDQLVVIPLSMITVIYIYITVI